MKRKLTSLFLVAGTMLTLNAQVMINEHFTAPFSAAAAGWVRINTSTTPSGVWAQGAGTVFPAYTGSPNDFYFSNFQASASTATNATISNWLVTPTITLKNGGVIEFATRTTTNPTQVPDGLDVYMSQGAGTNVGTTTSLGTFSTLLVSINPGLTTTGYPGSWTVYSATITGLSAPTVGRIGFRHYVTNGGPAGANSNYIGLDAVRYYNPCGMVVPNYTVCSGASTSLTGLYGASPVTYTWNGGASNNTTYVVAPSATTTYTLNYTENGNVCPAVTSTVTIGSQLSVSVTASAASVCPGAVVSLTAWGAGSSYTWAPSLVSGSVTTFTVNSPSVYSVAAQNGFCFGGNTVQINTFPNPTVSISSSQTLLCQSTASALVTFTGNGASTYIWVLGSQSAQSPTIGVTYAAPTSTTPATFASTLGLIGVDLNGCASSNIVTVTVSRVPTVAVSGATMVCVNQPVTLSVSATASSTFSWSNGGTTATSNYSNSAPGNYTVTATATNTDGCSTTASAITVTVNACVGIQKIDENSLSSSFYPNPFNQQLKVNGFNGVVELYNTTGQLVTRTQVNGSATIDTADLPKGVYFVQGYNVIGELTVTEKLIKH